MKTLPKTIAGKENKRHRLQLANWLREWQIDCLIRPSQPVDTDIPSVPAPGISAFRDFSPTAGHIVLLPPAPATRTAGRPIYVLVLKKVHDTCHSRYGLGGQSKATCPPYKCRQIVGRECPGFRAVEIHNENSCHDAFLVAPFSRFATPAVRGEWKTALRVKPLRVLCIWNTHLVSVRALSTGWPSAVTKLQTVELALEVHRHIHNGKPLKYVAERELGPPLQHPLDPRHAYLEEESALLAEHLISMEACSNDTSTVFPYEQKSGPLLLAAEDRVRYEPHGKNRKPRK